MLSMGISTISMAIFHSYGYVTNYQRVDIIKSHEIPLNPIKNPMKSHEIPLNPIKSH